MYYWHPGFDMKARIITDVDIDCCNRAGILSGLEHVVARIDRSDIKFDKHPTGVYFQNIPRDASTNVSLVDADVAGNFGFFKIDFLNVEFYNKIRDNNHLEQLMSREVDWNYFQYPEITDQLFHLNGHSHLLLKFKPTSVEDLAMILAIIRPAKAYLQSADWDVIRRDVWVKRDGDKYVFKRSHSFSYALAILVHLNLLIDECLHTDVLAQYADAVKSTGA